ncbi:MAG TPA: carboxypeptidase-like regulatory domain-containing protein [Terriglobia bacterium]|nr:carboxypeptidase-like regulatory domain-containing protein [Terriglobia bacterium]
MSQGKSAGGTRVRPACAAAIFTLALAFAVEAPIVPAKDLKKPSRVVTGTVLDKDDNPIESAAVTLTDVSTGKKNATYTQKDGRYQFSGLEPTRTYDVQANFHGESSQVRHVTPIDPRDRIVLHLKIPPPPEEEGEN